MSPRPKLFRGVGLSLALRLYLLLAAICIPAFLVHNIYNLRAVDDLLENRILEIVNTSQIRLENWISSLANRSFHAIEHDKLFAQELKRLVGGAQGVEGVSLFQASRTGSLSLVASHGELAVTTPSRQDVDAALLDKNSAEKMLVSRHDRNGEEYRSYSVPISSEGDFIRRTLNLQIAPDKVAPTVRELRQSALLGAIGVLLAVGLGIVCFFHFALRKPIQRMMAAMNRATEGDLTTVVPVSSGELGQLSHSYNHMMLQTRRGIEENRHLLEQVRGFNDELQLKVKEATQALEGKHGQLQAANEKLFTIQRQVTRLEKLASLGQVSTVLAHELGTPLNAISGHLQLLAEEAAGDLRVQGRLRVIDEQVDRLTRIVRNVLETMRLPPQKAYIDFAAVVSGVLDSISPLTEKQGIRVEATLEPGLPKLHADAGQIEQLLMNLFTNAMDAMKNGGILKVTTSFIETLDPVAVAGSSPALTAESDGCWLRLDVEDTGQGIPAQVQEKIFEPFFSTKAQEGYGPREAVGGGLGLGLAISEQIVKHHAGEIRILSQEGRGALFRIYFPLGSQT